MVSQYMLKRYNESIISGDKVIALTKGKKTLTEKYSVALGIRGKSYNAINKINEKNETTYGNLCFFIVRNVWVQ